MLQVYDLTDDLAGIAQADREKKAAEMSAKSVEEQTLYFQREEERLWQTVEEVPTEAWAGLNSESACTRPPSWKNGEVTHQAKLSVWYGGEAIGFSELLVISTRLPPETRQCRICFNSDVPELFDACACRGSMRYICSDCLLAEWEAAKKSAHDISNVRQLKCRLCHQSFEGRAAGLLGRQLGVAVKKNEKQKPPAESAEKTAERHMAEVAAATALWRQANHTDAAELFRKAITGLARINGAEHPSTLTAQHNLSLVLFALAQYEEAQTRVRAAQAGFLKLLGAEHPLTLKAGHNVAMVLQATGETEQAAAIYAETLAARQRVLGTDHIDTLKTAVNLGLALNRAGDHRRAEKQLRAAIAPLERVAGRKHPLTLTALQNLSITIIATDPGSDEAKVLAKEACEGRHLALGQDHPETLEGLRDWCTVLARAEDYEQAEEVGRRALSGMERVMGFQHPTTQAMVRKLKEVLEKQGRNDAAQELERQHQAGNIQEVPAAPEPLPRGPTIAVVLSLFIAEEHRRKGFGKAVMRFWKSYTSERGATSLEVCISSASSSLGFFTDGMEMVTAKDWEDNTEFRHLRWSF